MWVLVGIETDRGPWVAALVAAGYRVFAINPRQVARARERHGTSGAKSDAGDAHTLADLVRTDAHQLRPIAGDSPLVEGIKVIARAHQNLIWDRHRQMLRLRGSLREFFPAALAAWPDLTAPDAVELLAAAPDPERAAGWSRSKIVAALRRARRRDVEARAEQIQATLRGRQLTQPAELAGAYAVTGRAQVALIATLNTQITDRGEQVEAHVGRHPDAEMVALIRPDARASPRSTTRARRVRLRGAATSPMQEFSPAGGPHRLAQGASATNLRLRMVLTVL